MLENPAAAVIASSNKENFDAHHGGDIGELADPFGGSSNPYERQQPRARNFIVPNQPANNIQKNNISAATSYASGSSSNPYTKQHPYNMLSSRTQAPHIPNSTSPILTEEQKRRIEENRQRALAIRMKKARNS
jgi:hypothetical protein